MIKDLFSFVNTTYTYNNVKVIPEKESYRLFLTKLNTLMEIKTNKKFLTCERKAILTKRSNRDVSNHCVHLSAVSRQVVVRFWDILAPFCRLARHLGIMLFPLL